MTIIFERVGAFAGWRGQSDVARAEHGSGPDFDIMVAGPCQSGTSMAGFWQTGLLAANGSVTFPAFIFKNALAANIRKG